MTQPAGGTVDQTDVDLHASKRKPLYFEAISALCPVGRRYLHTRASFRTPASLIDSYSRASAVSLAANAGSLVVAAIERSW